MNKFLIAALAATAISSVAGVASAAAVTDTVQSPTGFFVPTDAQKYDAPYYRGYGQDWGWTHTAIGGAITTAELNISAFDVDAPSENDEIWALDSGTWTLLGTLAGASDIWAFTNFSLGANFFDDIATGLQVRMAIDTVTQGSWLVTLGKSSLSIDGGGLPPPEPGVPEPGTWALMLLGFGAVGTAIRSRRRALAA